MRDKWIARNKDGELYVYDIEPKKSEGHGLWGAPASDHEEIKIQRLPSDWFPEVTWADKHATILKTSPVVDIASKEMQNAMEIVTRTTTPGHIPKSTIERALESVNETIRETQRRLMENARKQTPIPLTFHSGSVAINPPKKRRWRIKLSDTVYFSRFREVDMVCVTEEFKHKAMVYTDRETAERDNEVIRGYLEKVGEDE